MSRIASFASAFAYGAFAVGETAGASAITDGAVTVCTAADALVWASSISDTLVTVSAISDTLPEAP